MTGYEPGIQELHRTLTAHHRHHGGTILRAYQLYSRIIEVRNATTYIAWGADFYPAGREEQLALRFTPRTVDWRYAGQDPLGIPYAVPCEAWVGVAKAADDQHTDLTRYEFDAGTWRLGGEAQRVLVSTTPLSDTLGDLALNEMRGGIGFSRKLPLDFEPATAGQKAELRSALMDVIGACINLASASP